MITDRLPLSLTKFEDAVRVPRSEQREVQAVPRPPVAWVAAATLPLAGAVGGCVDGDGD